MISRSTMPGKSLFKYLEQTLILMSSHTRIDRVVDRRITFKKIIKKSDKLLGACKVSAFNLVAH